jgi:hypothetical protein
MSTLAPLAWPCFNQATAHKHRTPWSLLADSPLHHFPGTCCKDTALVNYAGSAASSPVTYGSWWGIGILRTAQATFYSSAYFNATLPCKQATTATPLGVSTVDMLPLWQTQCTAPKLAFDIDGL